MKLKMRYCRNLKCCYFIEVDLTLSSIPKANHAEPFHQTSITLNTIMLMSSLQTVNYCLIVIETHVNHGDLQKLVILSQLLVKWRSKGLGLG